MLRVDEFWLGCDHEDGHEKGPADMYHARVGGRWEFLLRQNNLRHSRH